MVITTEIVTKAKEGVVLEVMFDYIGARNKYSIKLISTLKNNIIESAVFNTPKLMKFVSNPNFRNHRKGTMVAKKSPLTGGPNIEVVYITKELRWGFVFLRPLGLRLSGPQNSE